MFCFSNDDPKETCPLTFIYLYYCLMRQNLKETVCNAEQKNIHTKEVYLTLNNNCIFPNELSEAFWLRDNFIVLLQNITKFPLSVQGGGPTTNLTHYYGIDAGI